MAEAIVSVALQGISNLIVYEAGLLSGVKEDAERLQAELRRMQCFLKDADGKEDPDERVRNWVAEIRELAYDADDVVDAFLLSTPRQERKLCGLMSISMFSKGYKLHEIGTRIKSIRDRIGDIESSIHTYGYSIKFVNEAEASSSVIETRRRLRRTDPEDEDKDIVSLESPKKELMAQLKKMEDQLRVVSIVGMGGLGKTTLAKKLYNNIDVKQHFDFCSWVFISQQFSTKEVLLEMCLEACPGEDRQKLRSMEMAKLEKKLKNVLKEKRFLVVLDDIWKEEAWDSLKLAFPAGKKGSKILLTSRSKDVALYADAGSLPVEPPFLTDEQSWELLKKKSLLQDSVSDESQMKEFERLGKDIAKKCGGLPLAIAVLGGLLAHKSLKEWEGVRRDVAAQFIKLKQRSQYAGIDWILALSYHDLPLRLKPCFLYLSQFPEDAEIHKRELIRMWIAEGFIPDGERNETMEDVGEQYLEELVSRCMVQVNQRDHTGIGIKTLRMHDLMRDMCLSKAKEDNFLNVIQQPENNGAASTTNSTRRISVYCGQEFYITVPNKECGSRLRSLLYYFPSGYNCRISRKQVNCIFQNFKLLRVMKLDGAKMIIGYVPAKVSTLVHLRYLGLKGTSIDRAYQWAFPFSTLSESIGNLKCLYTLDLRSNKVHSNAPRIPNVLWKLECLRHLLLDENYVGDFRLDTLKNLESLKWVKAKDLIRNHGMLKLTNLRHLAIKFNTTKEAEKVLQSPILELGRLCTLKMSYKCSVPCSEKLSRCHLLTKLCLDGPIQEDPGNLGGNLNFLPSSLTKLTLRYSRLKHDPMVILEKLPNLRSLWMYKAYKGSKMVCSAHSFPRLEILELKELSGVEEWEIEEGAMPCLKSLTLYELYKLRMVPEGLKSARSLQRLEIKNCTREFERRVKVINGVEGEDFHKVRHVPSVTITARYW